VLHEMELASWTEHPSDLRQGSVDVGNRAQGEGAKCIVAGVIRQWDQLTVEPDEFHRHR